MQNKKDLFHVIEEDEKYLIKEIKFNKDCKKKMNKYIMK